MAEIDLPPTLPQITLMMDLSYFHIVRIHDLRYYQRIWSERITITFSRRLLVQSFMWSFIIILLAEAVKGNLLSSQSLFGRIGYNPVQYVTYLTGLCRYEIPPLKGWGTRLSRVNLIQNISNELNESDYIGCIALTIPSSICLEIGSLEGTYPSHIRLPL